MQQCCIPSKTTIISGLAGASIGATTGATVGIVASATGIIGMIIPMLILDIILGTTPKITTGVAQEILKITTYNCTRDGALIGAFCGIITPLVVSSWKDMQDRKKLEDLNK